MSLISFPPKPVGSDRESIFMRWVWDSLLTLTRVNEVQGTAMARTTRGTYQIPNAGGGTATSANVRKVVLAAPLEKRPHVVGEDWIVCRTWDGVTLGTSDIYVAKQFKHRISLTYEAVLDLELTYDYADDPDEPDFLNTPPVVGAHRQNQIRTVTKLDALGDPTDETETQRIVPPWCPAQMFQSDGITRTDKEAELGTIAGKLQFFPGDDIFILPCSNTGVVLPVLDVNGEIVPPIFDGDGNPVYDDDHPQTSAITFIDACSARQWAMFAS